METTPFLAIWGAIVSTIIATWNIIQGLQNRRKLKIEANIGHKLPGDPEKLYIYFIITNIGRRPIYVTGIHAIISKKRAFFIMTRRLPKMLKESEYHMEWIEDFTIFDQNIKKIYALDSTGKKWKVGKKNLKKFLKEGKEVLKQQKENSNATSQNR